MPSINALSFDLSPVRLSYVAALRSVVPQSFAGDFSYAQAGTLDIEAFLCLAASNPNGRFYGVYDNDDVAGKASQLAGLRQVSNVSFVSSLDKLPKNLAYFYYNSADACLSVTQRDALFSVAETHLAENGLFCCRYKAYENADEILRFLIAEYEPEMDSDQANEFLHEIKALGELYFKEHPIARMALDKAIERKDPKSFFSSCGCESTTTSGTFDVMSGLLPRGFAYAGDADIANNYMDLVAPKSSHDTLVKCRGQLLYEPIKDFALSRLVRNDVWVRLPAKQSHENHELFDVFTFGITQPKSRVPSSFQTQNGLLHFNSPLYMRLIELMTSLPIGIGDFLSHPAGAGMNPDEVVSAIHILVACGVAQPMRGRYAASGDMDISKPKWATAFNDYLTHAPVTATTVRVASEIIGESLQLSAREALVLQAINRVGVSLSAGVLQPELAKMVEKNPALAAQIVDAANLTDEVIHNLLSETMQSNASRWYAYGLLAA